MELYPTVEEKAANLLYFIVKDHPLADGNKPSAAALFIVFLERNALLLGREGRLRIDSNTLAAVTLLVALSDPAEKELMIALIIRMLTPVVDGSNYEEWPRRGVGAAGPLEPIFPLRSTHTDRVETSRTGL